MPLSSGRNNFAVVLVVLLSLGRSDILMMVSPTDGRERRRFVARRSANTRFGHHHLQELTRPMGEKKLTLPQRKPSSISLRCWWPTILVLLVKAVGPFVFEVFYGF